MDCSVYKDHKHTVAYGTKCCVLGHYLIVAHTTHLPWAKAFSFDTSIERDICYSGKEVPW